MFSARPITGRQVGSAFVAFFAVVAIVNTVMVRAAISTFTGIETKNPYQAGLLFDREIEASAEQDRRHWQVEAVLDPARDAKTALTVVARSETGLALAGLDAEAHFAHPASARMDRFLKLKEVKPGTYRAEAVIINGVWELDLVLSRNGTQLFRSTNRVVVKSFHEGKQQ